MKHWMASLSIMAVISAGLVTGCSGAANNSAAVNQSGTVSNGSASHTPANTATSTTQTPASNGTGNGTASTGNTTAGQTSSIMSNAQMKSVAKQMLDRYVQSHNDKTAAQYQVDINQILIPGLASAVAASAQSGVDYNHPVASSTVNITSTTLIDQYSFRAIAKANIKFKDGKDQNLTYHVMFSLDQSTGQWLIRSIG